MSPRPAAERTGSPETEKHVKFAQSKHGLKRLAGKQLPPALTLRRYAALLVAADKYVQIHKILASDDYSTAPLAYQEDYGFDAHADSDTVQKVLGNSLQKMHNLGEKVHSAAHTFWDALCFYKEHESSLPAGLKTRYPLSLLYEWNLDLHELADLLCPKPFNLNAELKPKEKACVAKSLGPRLVGDTVYPAAMLPQRPTPKLLTRQQACLLWWAQFMRYNGRWSDMANLAYVWSVSDIKDPAKRSKGKSPTSLQRRVQMLRKQHSQIPGPFGFMPLADCRLFLGMPRFPPPPTPLARS